MKGDDVQNRSDVIPMDIKSWLFSDKSVGNCNRIDTSALSAQIHVKKTMLVPNIKLAYFAISFIDRLSCTVGSAGQLANE